jgi:hypothetical protein
MSPSGEELVAACPEAWCRIAAISAPASAASQLEGGGTVGHFPGFVSAGPAATHGADSTIVRNGALALAAHMAWAHRFEAAETAAADGSQRGFPDAVVLAEAPPASGPQAAIAVALGDWVPERSAARCGDSVRAQGSRAQASEPWTPATCRIVLLTSFPLHPRN